jgi:hypothetical protein
MLNNYSIEANTSKLATNYVILLSLVSLAVPLASAAAAGCEHIPRVCTSSKGYECK